MITNWLTGDALLVVKEQMALVDTIGMEPVSALFGPKPVADPKPSKIVLLIKDIGSNEDIGGLDRRVQLSLYDKDKQGKWSMTVRLEELEMTLAKIFLRIKNFRSLRISAAGELTKYKYYQEPPFEAKRQAFSQFLSHLSPSLIGAASSLPQAIAIRRLFFPPDRAYLTSIQTEAFDLIAYLAPSLHQLRLCTNHSIDLPQQCTVAVWGDCQQFHRLFDVIKTCTGLQKLKIAGVCGCWPLLQDCIKSLSNLRHFELLTAESSFHGMVPPNPWFHDAFQLSENLKHLTISYKLLLAAEDPLASGAVVLGRLATLKINFDFYYWTEKNQWLLGHWLCGSNGLHCFAETALRNILLALSDNSSLSLELNCYVYGGEPNKQVWYQRLCLVILKLAAETKKRICGTFTYCNTTQDVIQRLVQDYSSLSIEEVANGQLIRDGTATIAFKN